MHIFLKFSLFVIPKLLISLTPLKTLYYKNCINPIKFVSFKASLREKSLYLCKFGVSNGN